MKKIALVVDAEDWAFDIEAKILKEKFKKEFQIDIFVSKKYEDDLFSILEDVKGYDMIHFFWRKILLQFETKEFKEKIKEHRYKEEDYYKVCNKISTGIYDHLFLEEDNIKQYEPIFNKYCRRYYTCSKKLENIYKKIKEYPNPWGTIHDTYDSNLYDGGNPNRFETKKLPFIVGWVGNSNWNVKLKDFKGFHSILNPVLDELIEEGYQIKKHFADKNIKYRTNEEMPSYYQEIDVCIITSTEEGTPRPLIEAMASGVPIISTNVGIVEESFGPKQKEFMIGKREIDNDELMKKRLKEKIIDLYKNPYKIKELSEENYQYGKNNSIDNLYQKYKDYFETFI